MHAVFANDFSPAIVSMYNASASVIGAGYAVMRLPLSAPAIPNAANPHDVISYIRGIRYCTASVYTQQHNFLGVAVESIAPSTYGAVCIGGPCQVRVGTSATYSTGVPLGVDTTTVGVFIEMAAASAVAMNCIPAIVLQTQNAVAADGFVDAFIEPVKVAGGAGRFT